MVTQIEKFEDKRFFGTDRFLIERTLGAGGTGIVYEAFDKNENRTVALKTLRNNDAISIESFKREFTAIKDIDHPNFIRYLEFFNENDQWFYTMEFVEGRDIVTYVRDKEHRFDEHKLRSCLSQLVSAIYRLHRKGKIHRDIKPSNIMVTTDERVVLLDFGLATEVIAGRQVSNIAPVGTKIYMSPEQSSGSPIGAPSDWYSVGVILYQILTGTLPFSGSSQEIDIQRYLETTKPPVELNPHVPLDLNELCVELMRSNPKARLTGSDVLSRLNLEEEPHRISDPPGAEWTVKTVDYVGRKDELDALNSFFAKTLEGKTASVVIAGEPGIGKTALANEFISRINRDGENAIVFAGRFSLGASIRFQAFKTIIAELRDFLAGPNSLTDPSSMNKFESGVTPLLSKEEATAVSQIFPTLKRVSEIAAAYDPNLEISNSMELRSRAFRAVRILLSRLAKIHPVVVFIDDIQWADPDSLSLLEDILNPQHSPPLLLLVTMRDEGAPDKDYRRTFHDAAWLPLQGLSPSESHELAESVFQMYGVGKREIGRDIDRIDEAKGHPLYLSELVHYAVTDGASQGAEGLEDALWLRISRFDKTARHLLELICLSGMPLDEETLVQVAGFEREQWVPALASLLVGNLAKNTGDIGAERIEPYHDRVKETVIAHLDSTQKKRHHLNLAYELSRSGDIFEKEIVVQHLEGAGRHQEAALLAEKAAKIASKQLAFGKAAELLITALRLGQYTHETRAKLQMRLGDALCNSGRGTEASKVYMEAGKEADVATRLDFYHRAIHHLMISGHFDEGYHQIDKLLVEIGESLPKTPKRALASLMRSRAKLKIRGTRWTKTNENEIPADKLAKVDIFAVVADGLALMDNIRGADFQARCLLLALKLGEEKRLAHALTMETIFLASQGTSSRKRAKQLLKESERIVEKCRDLFLYYGNFTADGTISYFEGRFAEAVQKISIAETGLRNHSATSISSLNSTRIFLVSSLRFLGQFNRLKDAFDEYVWDARQRGDRFLETSIRLLGNRVFLAKDSPEEAHENLDKSLWVPQPGGYHVNHWCELVARVELAIYEGNSIRLYDEFEASFKDLSRALLLRVITVYVESCWLKGRLVLSTLSRESTPRKALKEIAIMVRNMQKKQPQIPPVEIWCALLRAAIAFHHGNTADAIDLLRTAVVAAEKYEQHYLAATAKMRLGALLRGKAGDKLIASGKEWMKNEGIVNPERMAKVFAPGFDS